MYLLGLGLVTLLMKYLDIGPVANWSWWLVMLPFALAVVWWAWADWSGYTKRHAMSLEDARIKARAAKIKQALNTTIKKPDR